MIVIKDAHAYAMPKNDDIMKQLWYKRKYSLH